MKKCPQQPKSPHKSLEPFGPIIFNRRNLTLPSGQIDRSFSHVALISYTSDCDPAVGTGYHEGSQAVVPVPVYGFAILRFRLSVRRLASSGSTSSRRLLRPPARSVHRAARRSHESIRTATRRRGRALCSRALTLLNYFPQHPFHIASVGGNSACGEGVNSSLPLSTLLRQPSSPSMLGFRGL